MSRPGTGVDLTLAGEPEWNVGDYSVIEDAVALNPGDMSGGFGQITVNVAERPGTRRLGGEELSLTDGSQGEMIGVIRGQTGNGLGAAITADARLGLTAVTRRVEPFIGKLGDAIKAYLGLCGITSGIVIDTSISAVDVVLQGWSGIVYDQLKKLCMAHGMEMAVVSNNIVFRPVRGREAINYRNAAVEWSLDESDMAQAVTGYWYDQTVGTQLAWPAGPIWNPAQVQTYQVAANEQIVVDLELQSSLSEVEQPVCVEYLLPDHSTSSVYAVLNANEQIVSAPQWNASGGSVVVEVGEDTRSLRVTITGPNDPANSPFRLAMPTPGAENSTFSSLRIRGTGVFFETHTLTLPGNPNPDEAPAESGQVVNSEFFTSQEHLYHALLRTAARYGTPQQGISVRTKGINRIGVSGSTAYPTIGEANDLWPGTNIGQVNDMHPGWTIGDWNDFLFSKVANDFANQAFGNSAGARVRDGNSWYRIRTATTSQSVISYRAERDNTIGDVYHNGETIGDWNDRWAGLVIRDVNTDPLQGL